MITFEQFYKEFLVEDITFGIGEPPHYYSVSNVINGHITIIDGYPDQNIYSGGLLKTPPNYLLIDDFRDKQINNGTTNVRIKAALGYWTFEQNKALKKAIFHAARGRTAAPNASEINLRRSTQRISRNLLQGLRNNHNDAIVLRAESRSFWNRVVSHGTQSTQISKMLLAIDQIIQQIQDKVNNTNARLFVVNLLEYLQHQHNLDHIYRDIAELNADDPLTLSKESLAKLLAHADQQHNVINGIRINHIEEQGGYNRVEYNKLINSLTHNRPNNGIDAAYIKKYLKSINVFNDFNQVFQNTNTVIVVDDNINQGDTFTEINAKITNFFPNVQNIFWVIGIIKIKQPNPPIQQAAQAAQQEQQAEQEAQNNADALQRDNRVIMQRLNINLEQFYDIIKDKLNLQLYKFILFLNKDLPNGNNRFTINTPVTIYNIGYITEKIQSNINNPNINFGIIFNTNASLENIAANLGINPAALRAYIGENRGTSMRKKIRKLGPKFNFTISFSNDLQ